MSTSTWPFLDAPSIHITFLREGHKVGVFESVSDLFNVFRDQVKTKLAFYISQERGVPTYLARMARKSG